jgi:hypothetical protein
MVFAKALRSGSPVGQGPTSGLCCISRVDSVSTWIDVITQVGAPRVFGFHSEAVVGERLA